MSNYPPGMTHSDFVRAGIEDPPGARAHDCEWVPVDPDEPPRFEDAAAHFTEKCLDAGAGRHCEGRRSYRFDIESISHEETGVVFDVTRHPPEANTELENYLLEDVIDALWRDISVEVVEVDPDRDDGEVIVRIPEQSLRVRFAA